MSSPKMTRMFGFLPAWAAFAATASLCSARASSDPRSRSLEQHVFAASAALPTESAPPAASCLDGTADRGRSAVAAAGSKSAPDATRAKA